MRTCCPGASALATYLGLLGVQVEPGLLTELLVLLGVLSLEIRSALSVVLVRSTQQASRRAPEGRQSPSNGSEAYRRPVTLIGRQRPF